MPIVGNKNIHNLGVFEEKTVQCKQNKRKIFSKNAQSQYQQGLQGIFLLFICKAPLYIYVVFS